MKPEKTKPPEAHYCSHSECKAYACYGLNNKWFCPAHVPPGFLPNCKRVPVETNEPVALATRGGDLPSKKPKEGGLL